MEASAGEGGGWRAPEPSLTIPKTSSGRVGEMGSRLLFEGKDGSEKLVEHLAGEVTRTVTSTPTPTPTPTLTQP